MKYKFILNFPYEDDRKEITTNIDLTKNGYYTDEEGYIWAIEYWRIERKEKYPVIYLR